MPSVLLSTAAEQKLKPRADRETVDILGRIKALEESKASKEEIKDHYLSARQLLGWALTAFVGIAALFYSVASVTVDAKLKEFYRDRYESDILLLKKIEAMPNTKAKRQPK